MKFEYGLRHFPKKAGAIKLSRSASAVTGEHSQTLPKFVGSGALPRRQATRKQANRIGFIGRPLMHEVHGNQHEMAQKDVQIRVSRGRICSDKRCIYGITHSAVFFARDTAPRNAPESC